MTRPACRTPDAADRGSGRSDYNGALLAQHPNPVMRTSGWMNRTNTAVLAVATIVASREMIVHSARLALGPHHPVAVVAPFACDAVSPRDIISPLSRIDSGEYTLTLIATGGSSSGASVRGRLWLRRTSMLDTAAATRALAADTARIPLYGAVNVDFAGVGVPVTAPATGAVSDPRSFDPMRPGVLVAHHTSRAIGEGRWRLLIGTTANDRRTACDSAGDCPPTPAVGSGLALRVSRIGRGDFAGNWTAISATDGDGARGYFCAVPVHYFGYPYPQKLHIP